MKKGEVALLSNEDGLLRIGIKGQINTNNASEIDKNLNEFVSANDFESLILDLADLEYTSSAGIRVLVKLFKEQPTLKLENLTPEVYEILEMTGITTIIPVTKKLREFSVDGLEKIGAGFNGVVYRLDDDTILKVVNEMHTLDEIQRERDASQKAFLLGVPTAISYDVVKVGDLFGIIYELLDSKTYNTLLLENQDDIERLGREFGQLARKVNDTIVEDENFRNAKDNVYQRIEKAKDLLSEEDYKLIRGLFDVIPDTDNFIHGDFHPGNVLVQQGEPLLIDMATSGKGHPIFDLISFALPVIGSVEQYPDDYISAFTNLTKKQNYQLWDAFLEGYFDTDDQEYLDKVREQILIRVKARKVVDLMKYVKAFNDIPKEEEEKDQRSIIKSIGLDGILKSIEENLKYIREHASNMDEPFFF